MLLYLLVTDGVFTRHVIRRNVEGSLLPLVVDSQPLADFFGIVLPAKILLSLLLVNESVVCLRDSLKHSLALSLFLLTEIGRILIRVETKRYSVIRLLDFNIRRVL